jgi:hypothetical protein
MFRLLMSLINITNSNITISYTSTNQILEKDINNIYEEIVTHIK